MDSLATRARVRFAFTCASSLRASTDASWERSTLLSSSRSTCPCRTTAPDSKWMADTSPGASLLSVTPFAGAMLPTASSDSCQVSCRDTKEPTASGGGPAFSMA